MSFFNDVWPRFQKIIPLMEDPADPTKGVNLKSGANGGLLVEPAPGSTALATQTTLAAILTALGQALPLPTRAAVDKALRSANHTLHDSTACTTGAVAMSVDTSGTYTMRLKNDTGDVTHYLSAGSLYAMEPALIKSTGSPAGAKATLYFLT
jgi:hypothetical protein